MKEAYITVRLKKLFLNAFISLRKVWTSDARSTWIKAASPRQLFTNLSVNEIYTFTPSVENKIRFLEFDLSMGGL